MPNASPWPTLKETSCNAQNSFSRRSESRKRKAAWPWKGLDHAGNRTSPSYKLLPYPIKLNCVSCHASDAFRKGCLCLLKIFRNKRRSLRMTIQPNTLANAHWAAYAGERCHAGFLRIDLTGFRRSSEPHLPRALAE